MGKLIKMDYTLSDFYCDISESDRRAVYDIVDLIIVDTINRYHVDYDREIPPRYIEMVFNGLSTHTITYPVDRNFKLFERIILDRYSYIIDNRSEYNLQPILKNTEKLNGSCDVRQRYFTDDQISSIKDSLNKIYDDNIDNIVRKYRDGFKEYSNVFNQDTVDEMCDTYRKTIEFITKKDGEFVGTLDKYRKINDKLSENGLIEPYINTDVVFNSYESRLIKNILYSVQTITGLCCITDAFVNECKDLIINIFNERNLDLDTNKIDELSDIILFYNKEYYYKEVKSPYSGLISKIKIPVNGDEYTKQQIREEISAKYGINKNSTDEELNFIISDYSKNHNVLDKLDPKSEFDYIREFVGNKKKFSITNRISIADCQANFDKLSDEVKKHVYKIVDTHIINISKRHPSAFKSCEIEKLSLGTTIICNSVLTNEYNCNDYFDQTMTLFLRKMIVERYCEIHDVDKNKKIVADMSALSKKIINALNNNINKKVEIVKPKSKFSKILDIIFDKPKDKLNKKTINRVNELNKKLDGSYIKPNSPIKGKFIGLMKSVFNIFFPTPKEIKPVEIKPTGLKNLTHDRFNELIEHNAKTIYAGGDFDLPSHRGPLFVDYNMIDEHNDSLKEETETLSEFISKYNKSEEVVCEPMFRKIHKRK